MTQQAYIAGINYYLPPKVETNEFLVKEMRLSWTADYIYDKTGIMERHVTTEECASDLGYEAALRLFAKYEGLKDKIDYIIFCSQSADYVLPTTACVLQHRLGISRNCGAIDVNQGCSGFIYSLSLAKGLIAGNIASNILIITAETYTKYIEPNDKSTRTIFGDGAAATWLSATDGNEKISSFVLGTDGRGMNNLIVPNSGSRKDDEKSSWLFMDGPEIFQFTLLTIPKIVKKLIQENNLSIEDIDYFIFHQANAFILEHLRNKLNLDKDKFCMDMKNIGNTVSASIPIALCRAMNNGVVKQKMKVMLIGFGVGYSWGSCIVEI